MIIIDDEYVLNELTNGSDTGLICPSKVKELYLSKECPEVLEYMLNRFDDTDENTSLNEIAYRIYHKIELVPRCQVCNRPIPFKNGYHNKTFCSKTCAESAEGRKIWSEHMKETFNEKYGGDSPFCSEDIRNKSLLTIKERYEEDVVNVFLIDEIKQKSKDTLYEHYGVIHPMKNIDIVNKMKNTQYEKYYSGTEEANKAKEDRQEKYKNTIKEHYGVEYPLLSELIINKIKEHNLNVYNTEYYFNSDDFKNKREKTMIEKYGVLYPLQNEELKQKQQNTNLERYGAITPLINDDIKIKTRKTNQEKYNCDYYSLTDEFKERYKETSYEKYGVDNISKLESTQQKIKLTNIEKYGYEYPQQNPEIHNKIVNSYMKHYYSNTEESKRALKELQDKTRNTMIERYGVEYALLSPEILNKMMESNLLKWGVKCTLLNPEIHKKSIMTLLEKYGVDNPTKCSEILLKLFDTNIERYGYKIARMNPIINQKIIDTNIKRYGYEYKIMDPEYRKSLLIEKSIEYGSLENYYSYIKDCASASRKKNKKYYGMSKIEFLTYQYLTSIFSKYDVLYDVHIDDRYNFAVDFYIISLDFFIEINGYWTHNTHLFDINNEEDLKILNKWKERSIKSELYRNAIKVWTERDVLKTMTAIENNLLYLPIWSNDINVIKDKILEYASSVGLIIPEPKYTYTDEELFTKNN